MAICLVELILSQIFESQNFSVLEVLRAMRAFRLLKIARYNVGMRRVLSQKMKSLYAIGSFSSLLLLFLLIWALLGSELFAYRAVIDQNGDLVKAKNALSML